MDEEIFEILAEQGIDPDEFEVMDIADQLEVCGLQPFTEEELEALIEAASDD